MLDRTETETVLYRVAICAFTYYPDKPELEPGYTIEEDVVWCSAPLVGLENDQVAELRDVIRTLIADPAADRRGFIATLAQLADD